MRYLLMSAAAIALLSGCTPKTDKPDSADTPDVEVQTHVPNAAEEGLTTSIPDVWGDFGLNMDTMDTTVAPGDDFYKYVNGKWLATFEIPQDRARYGSFSLLAEKSEQRVRKIIEELGAAHPSPDSLDGKVAAIYNAYMDTDAIEAAGLKPARPYLDRIAAISSRADLADVFASNGFASPIGGWVDVDSKQTDQYSFYVNQAGLGMGDRDYYLVDTDKNLELRAAYKKLLTTLLSEAGYDDPGAAADSVIALETQIAKAHWDRAAGRNRDLTYHKMSKAELIGMAGSFPLARMIDGMQLSGQNEYIVRQVTPTTEEVEKLGLTDDVLEKVSGGGVQGIFNVAQSAPLDSWKAYLTAHFLSDHSDTLPKRIDDADFAFYGKAMRGTEVQRKRWKRAVSTVEGSVGEAVGKIYADRYFPKANKAAMDELVANLHRAMAADLDTIDWMSDDTKIEARKKLNKFTPKIGYPEKFETYDTLTVDGSAFDNEMAVGAWQWQDMISKLGTPIDKTEWFMLPQTVNAYYSPNRNEIVFPAAILQPPFFNLSADPAVNYGGIGGVIGHEMSHGFDDQGAKSDGDGMLRNWWTDEDLANFKAKTAALVAQYNADCPLDDGKTCVNGELTLGENIGDLSGLTLAYKAYKMSLNGKEAPVIDGLTGDQRFFLSWAQVWRAKYRDEATRQQLTTDPHSPPYYRVNSIVRNFDEWYKAFDVGPDNALYLPPEERIHIW